MLHKKISLDFLKKIIRRKHQVERYSLPEEAVIWAYRLLLDRDPENLQVINDKRRRLGTVQELRQELMQSDEFKRKNSSLKSLSLSGNEPPMLIEDLCSEVMLQNLLKRIQDSWTHLGDEEPYWSVITSGKFLSNNIQENEDVFYDSGKTDVDKLFNFFRRNDIEYRNIKSSLEYGCGLGRVTIWLAKRFDVVYGYDISHAHLNGTEQYLNKIGIDNVILRHVKQIEDIQNLPKVDLVYSILVLQHNPPPLIKLIIREFVKALNPGGIAFFQVPTYRLGYSFSLKQYLNESPKHEMEMHVLPQKQIFEIIGQEGGRVVEVLEDDLTGLKYKEISNTFLLQKR